MYIVYMGTNSNLKHVKLPVALSAVSILLMLCGAMAQAQVANPPPSGQTACQTSYRFDAFGMGVLRGFKQERGDVPKLIDTFCYKMGEQQGAALRTSHCAADFNYGYEAGRIFSTVATGTVCYRSGYLAGNAQVRVAAREGNSSQVSANCISKYREYYTAGYTRRGRAFPTHPALERECAMAGYFDGGWLNMPSIDSLLEPI